MTILWLAPEVFFPMPGTYASNCPIITESEGTQSVVQSDGICIDCCSPIVSTPLPVTVKNYPWSSTLVSSDYYPTPTQVLPLPRFCIRFFTRPFDPPGNGTRVYVRYPLLPPKMSLRCPIGTRPVAWTIEYRPWRHIFYSRLGRYAPTFINHVDAFTSWLKRPGVPLYNEPGPVRCPPEARI